MNRVAPFQPPE